MDFSSDDEDPYGMPLPPQHAEFTYIIKALPGRGQGNAGPMSPQDIGAAINPLFVACLSTNDFTDELQLEADERCKMDSHRPPTSRLELGPRCLLPCPPKGPPTPPLDDVRTGGPRRVHMQEEKPAVSVKPVLIKCTPDEHEEVHMREAPNPEKGQQTLDLGVVEDEEEQLCPRLVPQTPSAKSVVLKACSVVGDHTSCGPSSDASDAETPRQSLLCTVGPGVRVCGSGLRSHVEYTITTLATMIESWPTHGVQVRRRFSDFLTLHDALVAALPNAFLPAAPNKSLGTGSGGQMLTLRQAQLQRYLNRLAAHPQVLQNSSFKLFLQYQGQLLPASAPTWSLPGVSSVPPDQQLIRKKLARVELSTRADVSPAEAALRDGAKVLDSVQGCLANLQAAAHQVGSHFQQMAKASQGLHTAMQALAAADKYLGAGPLQFATLGKQELVIATSLKTAASMEQHAAELVDELAGALHDEMNSIKAAQGVLLKREVALLESLEIARKLGSTWNKQQAADLEVTFTAKHASYEAMAEAQAAELDQWKHGLAIGMLGMVQGLAASQEKESLQLNLLWIDTASKVA